MATGERKLSYMLAALTLNFFLWYLIWKGVKWLTTAYALG